MKHESGTTVLHGLGAATCWALRRRVVHPVTFCWDEPDIGQCIGRLAERIYRFQREGIFRAPAWVKPLERHGLDNFWDEEMTGATR